VHLPTCDFTAIFWCSCLAQIAPTSAALRHTRPQNTAISNSLPSPLFTAGNSTNNHNMSAASLHPARWRASEVVLLDIGESRTALLESSVPPTQPESRAIAISLRHLCDACDRPLRCSGQQPSETQQATRSDSSCLAAHSRALVAATPGSAYATTLQPFIRLSCTLQHLPSLRGTLLTMFLFA
jgi:hypothetical protein